MPVIVGAVGTAGQLALGAIDASKRREMEFALANLDSRQKAELAKKIQSEQSAEARLKILTDTVAQIQIEKNKAKIQKDISSQRNLMITIIGGGLLLILSIYLLKK